MTRSPKRIALACAGFLALGCAKAKSQAPTSEPEVPVTSAGTDTLDPDKALGLARCECMNVAVRSAHAGTQTRTHRRALHC